MRNYANGEKHNRLTLISLHQKKLGGNLWNARCDCGNEIVAYARDIRKGHTRSCGCLRTEILKSIHLTHGKTKTKEYRIWSHMRGRCNNPTDSKYARYGGRGIKTCVAWDNFEQFLKDMGKCPAGLSIDRVNNDGDYEPSNCRWADAKTQSHNSTQSKKVFLEGEIVHSLSEAARRLGIYHTSIQQRAKDFGETYQQAADHFAAKRRN